MTPSPRAPCVSLTRCALGVIIWVCPGCHSEQFHGSPNVKKMRKTGNDLKFYEMFVNQYKNDWSNTIKSQIVYLFTNQCFNYQVHFNLFCWLKSLCKDAFTHKMC